MSIPDPRSGEVVERFDAWHAHMTGPEAHEQMLQRRLNARVDQQIELGLGNVVIEVRDAYGHVFHVDAEGYLRDPMFGTYVGLPKGAAGEAADFR